MKQELFIGEDLRTLQKKIKDDKSSENLIGRVNTPSIIGKTVSAKTSEKIIAEKSSETIDSKTSEKIIAEKSSETVDSSSVSPEAWQKMLGIITSGAESDDSERLL